MKVTVIPCDHTIICDGVAVRISPWPFADVSTHAIQWDEDHGEIEHTGFPRPANTAFTDSEVVEPYVAAHTAATSPPPEPA